MSKQDYYFKYGHSKVKVALDPGQVAGELKIREVPALTDPATAIREAIRNPIASLPLREIVKPGQTVAIIVNDPTRVANSDVIVPVLLTELNEVGIPDANVSIIFALGTHRAMTETEMIETVGAAIANRVKLYNPDCRAAEQFVHYGTTSRGTPVAFHRVVAEADHIICTGSVVHHFFAGFGGGRKAMLPGVAAYETIRRNHRLMLDPEAIIGKLAGNPVYEDQVEGVEMHRPSFLVNVVLNEKKEFLRIFAGDYRQAHLEACQFVDSVYGAPIAEPADLVIASCGGYPKDINIYQLQKTMDNAWGAVRDGGVVIILGECAEGSGSATYEKTMRECCTPERVEAKLREDFQIGAHKAYAVTRLMKKAKFILVSTLDPDLARTLLFTPAATIEAALAQAYEIVGENPRIILMPQGSLTVPVKA